MKDWIKANRGLLIFLVGFGLFRTGIADWNPIPSGSMRPTLLEGDVVLVNRLAYDIKLPLTDFILAHLAEPKRGDIVTFTSPKDGKRLIKRIVALPGDSVEMRNEVLFINGQAAAYDDIESVREPLENGMTVTAVRANETVGDVTHRMQILKGARAASNFGPVTVPAEHFLMLGDNRDNSADSRVFGFVPRQLLIGQAQRVLVSADIKGNWLPRLERVGQALN